MSERADQRAFLISELSPWLRAIDDELAALETALADRPLKALIRLFRYEALEVRSGEETIDASSIASHGSSEWFAVLYDAVHGWYEQRYSIEAVAAQPVRPLQGLLTIWGTPFGLAVPAQRGKVEQPGETAWMYFEEGVHASEPALEWVRHGPDFAKIAAGERETIQQDAQAIAGQLRFLEFRRLSAKVDDPEVRKLIAVACSYVQQAAKRILTGREDERGQAWFDLQMTAESALKAQLRHSTGKQPHIHSIPDLVKDARKAGVTVEDEWIEEWPAFSEVSEWRYGQGTPGSLPSFYNTYRNTLRIAQGSLANLPTLLVPGFGILLRYAPWKRVHDLGRRKVGDPL